MFSRKSLKILQRDYHLLPLTYLQKQIKLPTYGAVLPCRAMKKSLIPSTIEIGSQVVKNRSIPCIVRTGKSCREESALLYPQYPFRFSLYVY
jgi:hypothetical protein